MARAPDRLGIVFLPHLAQHVGQLIAMRHDRGDLRVVLVELVMAVEAHVGQLEIGRRIADVVIAVAVDARRILRVDPLREVPMVRPGRQSLGLVGVALAAHLEMGAELRADKAERLFVGPGVVLAVSAVTVVAGQPLQVVDAAHEMDDGVGQFAAGRQMAGRAVRGHRRQRMPGRPVLGGDQLARRWLARLAAAGFGRWLVLVSSKRNRAEPQRQLSASRRLPGVGRILMRGR